MYNFEANFLAFAFLNVIVITSGVLIALRLYNFEIKSWAKFLLVVAGLFFLLVFDSQILLGIFGVLNFRNLILLHLVLLLLIYIFFGRDLSGIKITALRKEPSPWLILAFFSPYIVIWFVRFFEAIHQIPLEYDNIAYHLPFVVEWLKTSSLNAVYYSAFASPIGHYPSNFELLDLWVMLPFWRDYFVNLLNFPIAILLMVALYKTARNLGARESIAMLTVGLFMYMPQTFRQLGVPLVDLFFTLTFVLAIYFLTEFARHRERSDILMFGISLGLFIGTKYLGIVYAAVPLLIAVVLVIKDYRFSLKQIGSSALIVFLSSVIAGGFWYIRNWIDSGNPIFPMDVSILGKKIFEGYAGVAERLMGLSLWANLHSLAKIKEFILDFYYMVGFQSLLIPIVFLLLVLFLIKNLFLKSKDRWKKVVLCVVFILSGAIYFFLYIKAPYTYINLMPNVRYAMMFLIVFVLAAGFVFEHAKVRPSLMYLMALLIFIFNILLLIINPPPLIPYNDVIHLNIDAVINNLNQFAYFVAIILLIVFAFGLLRFSSKNKIFMVIAILFVIGTYIPLKKFFRISLREREAASYSEQTKWYSNRNNSNYLPLLPAVINASRWFDQNDPGAKIAYTGFNFHYYLFGRDLLRQVDYININECYECRYTEYKNSASSIRRDPSYENWMDNLKRANKQYIVIAPYNTEGVYSYEFEWVKNHPEKFESVFEQSDLFVYKIKQ